jgi:hypothetical protein
MVTKWKDMGHARWLLQYLTSGVRQSRFYPTVALFYQFICYEQNRKRIYNSTTVDKIKIRGVILDILPSNTFIFLLKTMFSWTILEKIYF